MLGQRTISKKQKKYRWATYAVTLDGCKASNYKIKKGNPRTPLDWVEYELINPAMLE